MRICIVIIILIFSFYNLFAQPKPDAKRIALLNIKGYNVTNVIGRDERLCKKIMIESITRNYKSIVLGSSRVMKLDNELIPDNDFFNIGVSSAGFEDIVALYYLYRLKGLKPQKIYIGIDPWLLEKNADKRWNKIYKNEFESFSTILLQKSKVKFPTFINDGLATKHIIDGLYSLDTYMFKKKDFVENYIIDSIYKNITKDIKPRLIFKRDSVCFVNKQIMDPSLYDKLSAKMEVVLTTLGENLVFETNNYRKKKFKKLEAYQKNNVMKLNRIILELTYACPGANLSEEFPVKRKYNKAATQLSCGAITYPASFRERTVEEIRNKAKKNNKRPYMIKQNMKITDDKKVLFESFVDHLISEDIVVNLVLIPYHHITYKFFKNSKEYNSPILMEKYLVELSKSKNINLLGSYNPESYNLMDADFFDGVHVRTSGLEKLGLR